MTHNVFAHKGLALVGYRGTGKTTVGRILAERLGWRFADADLEVERLTGRSVSTIFSEDGEPTFREWEERVVANLCTQPSTVIATGGGAILRESSRLALRSFGLVVWLTADPETLSRRLLRDQNRPNARPALTVAGTLDEIAAVLAARTSLYREVSHLEIDTVGQTGPEVAQAILRDWPGREISI